MLAKITRGFIKAIFKIIDKMFGVIFSPVFSVLNGLFPDLTFYLSSISSFFSLCATYVGVVSACLFIPTDFFTLFFGYLTIKYSIQLAISTIHFTAKVFNYLKP